jgi:hypothetical protein
VRDAAENVRPSVFISYSRPDSHLAARLASRLSEAGADVFLDSNLAAGANFSQVLVEAIDRSDYVVALVSPDYLASDWAQGELAAALSSRKRVLPVLVRPTVVEGPLSYIQFLDATSGTEAALDKTVELITGAS